MMLLEYLAYMLMYGYVVFGLFYFVFRLYDYCKGFRLVDVEKVSPISVEFIPIRELNDIFSECNIKQIER